MIALEKQIAKWAMPSTTSRRRRLRLWRGRGKNNIMNLPDIQQKLRKFAEDRNWDQFHSPKNLSMALAAETAELLEIFQWLTEEQSKDIVNSEKEIAQVKEEIADVFIYLVRLADKLNIDIEKES